MIYMITDGESYKVGFTDVSAESRLSSLQVGNPKRLEIVATIASGTQEDERWWHTRFASRRVSGEWFALSVHHVADFLTESVDRSGPDVLREREVLREQVLELSRRLAELSAMVVSYDVGRIFALSQVEVDQIAAESRSFIGLWIASFGVSVIRVSDASDLIRNDRAKFSTLYEWMMDHGLTSLAPKALGKFLSDHASGRATVDGKEYAMRRQQLATGVYWGVSEVQR